MRPRIWIPEAPHLALRRHREIGELRTKVGVQGRFTVELIHARTGLIARRLQFGNHIVDTGMNGLASVTQNDLTNYFAVGTGTTPPEDSDTTLENEVARTNSNGGFTDDSGVDTNDNFAWRRRTRVFTTSQANGNLTEVGVFQSSSSGTMFARQLLLDELGEPTTIVKTSEYELRIIYEFRIYVSSEQLVYDCLVNGDPVGVTSQAMGLGATGTGTSSNWNLSLTLGELSNAGNTFIVHWRTGNCSFGTIYDNAFTGGTSTLTWQTSSSGIEVQTYTNGNFYRDTQFTFGANFMNSSELKGFRSGTPILYGHIFDDYLEKLNTQRMVVMARVSWDRHEDY